MSQPPNVGTTPTGGIQDIAGLLPLLGTDQCQKHMLLSKGPLRRSHGSSNFRQSRYCQVLISSISILYLKFSVTFHGRRWLGARTGFKPVGTVAPPTFAMDGTRYVAETRLMQILKEKDIEDPERLCQMEIHKMECHARPWMQLSTVLSLTLHSFRRVLDSSPLRLFVIPYSITRHLPNEASHNLHDHEPIVDDLKSKHKYDNSPVLDVHGQYPFTLSAF